MSAPSDRDWLQSEWQRIFDNDAGHQAFLDLAHHYDRPERAYHNLHHLRHVLETIARFQSASRHLILVRLAAWFHDVIHDPRATDNEERSAAYAEQALRGLQFPGPLIRRVAELILLTQTHNAPASDEDAAILLDADLGILGAPEDEYDRYATAIRQEYAHVSDDDFRRGRRAVLERFLHRERIFRTDEMFSLLEERARANLRREIERLNAGSSSEL